MQVEKYKEEIETYQSEKLKLEGIIRTLEKDIASKNKHQERDAKTHNKVRCLVCPSETLSMYVRKIISYFFT